MVPNHVCRHQHLTEIKLGCCGELNPLELIHSQLCNHYINNTIDLAEALGIEPRTTESKSVVIPFHYAPLEWWTVWESNPPITACKAAKNPSSITALNWSRLFTAQPSKAGVCGLHTTYHIVLRMQGRVFNGLFVWLLSSSIQCQYGRLQFPSMLWQ